jgi:hypothetical protein
LSLKGLALQTETCPSPESRFCHKFATLNVAGMVEMATIRNRGEYQWEAQVRRNGYPAQRKTFETKADAQAWARMIESEIDRGIFVSRAEAERTALGKLAPTTTNAPCMPPDSDSDQKNKSVPFSNGDASTPATVWAWSTNDSILYWEEKSLSNRS